MTQPDNSRLMHGGTVHLTIHSDTGTIQASGALTGVTTDADTGNVLSLEMTRPDPATPVTAYHGGLREAMLDIAHQRDTTNSAVARAAVDKALTALGKIQPLDLPATTEPVTTEPDTTDTHQ